MFKPRNIIVMAAVLIALVAVLIKLTGYEKPVVESQASVKQEKTDVSSQTDASLKELLNQVDIFVLDKGIESQDFTLESLKGGKKSFNQFRGKAVLLNFWATW